MILKQSKLALAVVASLGVAACGGSDNGGGGGNGDNNTPDSLQQDAVDNGQVSFTAASDISGFSIDSDTYAVDAGGTTPATSLPGSLDSNDYYGAVDPSTASQADAWWFGWTAHSTGVDGSILDIDYHPLEAELDASGTPSITAAGSEACATVDPDFTAAGTVDVFGQDFPVCVIGPDALSNNADGSTVSLPNNHVFILDGIVEVGNGGSSGQSPGDPNEVTVNIAEGTQIFGADNTDNGGALVITRGSNINVNGTADAPVVMGGVSVTTDGSGAITGVSGDPTDLSGRGEFGGLVIDGFASSNAGDSNGEVESEVVPEGDTRVFGGNTDNDDSGSIQYLVIAESGFAFRPNEEVQGLTLEAVGSGTSIEYVQILGSDDDGIEWFGGTAGVSHAVIAGATDDSLDMDLGYRGTVQYALVKQGAQYGNRGIESDGNGDDFDAQPFTAPVLANVTILGNAGNSGRDSAESTTGALHREGWRGDVWRSVISDDTIAGGQFTEGCLDVDDVLPSDLQYVDAIFNCDAGSVVAADD
jgi:hypothetical protein